MKHHLATLAIATLTLSIAACNSTGGPTAPDSWLRVATKHGTVAVDPAANPVAVVAAIESGFARARTRTRDPAKLDRLSCEGWIVEVSDKAAYHGIHLVTITRGAEFSLDHETQHLLADQLGIRGPCLQYQDHANDNPWGGCDLDGQFAKAGE